MIHHAFFSLQTLKVGFDFCYFYFNEFLSSPYKYITVLAAPYSIQFPVFSDSTAGQNGHTSAASEAISTKGISAKMVTAVQVRVPSSLPPSEGVLRLHSQKVRSMP